MVQGCRRLMHALQYKFNIRRYNAVVLVQPGRQRLDSIIVDACRDNLSRVAMLPGAKAASGQAHERCREREGENRSWGMVAAQGDHAHAKA
eukprot:7378067-Prymnesium_polylepis.2